MGMMSQHKGLLSGVAYLAGVRDVIISFGDHYKMPVFNADHLFYTTAFQSGVDRFLLVEGMSELVQPTSPFAKSRLDTVPDVRYTHESTLRSQLPVSFRGKHSFQIAMFLDDLFIAMDSNASLLYILPMPDPQLLDGLLPTEFLIPIRNLFSSFETTSAEVPIPRFTVDRKNIERFEEVLQGLPFVAYRDAHIDLGQAGVSKSRALSEITSTSRTFVRKNASLAKAGRVGLSILTLTPKIIDAVFGKLPGALAELLGKRASSALDDRKRIVVYNCHAWIESVIFGEFRSWLERADELDADRNA